MLILKNVADFTTCLGIHAATHTGPSVLAMIALCNMKDKGCLTFLSLSCLLCSSWIWLCSGLCYLLEASRVFAGLYSFCPRVLFISPSINFKQPMPTVHFPVLCFPGLAGKGMTYVILQPSCHLPDISIESSAEKLVLLWFLGACRPCVDRKHTFLSALLLSVVYIVITAGQFFNPCSVCFCDFRHTAVDFYQP